MPRKRTLPAALICFLAAAVPAAWPQEDDYRAAIRRAEEALSRDDPVAGLDWVDRALRLDPGRGEALRLLGHAYLALGQYDDAVAAFQRGAERAEPGTPAWIEALYGKADALARAEKNVEAIETLRRILEASPDHPAIHHDLGRIHLALGRLQWAIEEFRREIDLQAGGQRADPSVIGSAYEGLGIAAYRAGDDTTALDALLKAPQTPEVVYHRGLVLMRTGRPTEAATALRRVLQADPDHRGALQNLARCAALLGDEEERARAIERFETLYARDVEEGARRIRLRDLRKKAERAALEGDFAGAVSLLEQAAVLAPDDLDIRMDLARWHYRAGHPDRSEQVFRAIVRDDPSRADAHYRLGRLLAERGDLSQAIASLERAARLSPMSSTYHVFLAQTYMRMNRPDDGVRELRLAQRLDPDDPQSFFNLGLALAQAGRLKEAAGQLEEAVRLGFADARIHQVLATIYQRLGDPERSRKARETFDRLSGGERAP